MKVGATSVVACLVVLACSGLAEAQQDARKVLEQAAWVVREAKTLSFRTEAWNEKSFYPADIRTILDVHMRKVAGEGEGETRHWETRASGKVTGLSGAGTGGSDDMVLEYLHDGKYMTWVDHDDKQVNTQVARANAKGPVLHMVRFGLPFHESLTAEEPYAPEMEAAELAMGEATEVAGVMCNVVEARDADREDMVTKWYFGQDDHLPRRYETILGDMALHTVVDITNVRVDPDLPEGTFEVPVPEGFQVKDTRPRQISRGEREVAPIRARNTNPVGVEEGNTAPGFELEGPGASRTSLSSLRGKVVVLDFFGSWCIPAEDAAPELQALAEHFEDQPVEVYGLACKEASTEAPVEWMEDLGVSYGLLLDADNVAKTYQVRQYPTRFVIGFNGEVLHSSKGFDPSDSPFPEIRTLIEEYLADPPAPQGAGRDANRRMDQEDGRKRDDG